MDFVYTMDGATVFRKAHLVCITCKRKERPMFIVSRGLVVDVVYIIQ